MFAIFGQTLSILVYGLSCHVAPASFSDNSEVLYRLEKYNVDSSSVTVSGFSAGAAMANQMTVAHSSEIMGIAIFSQGAYKIFNTVFYRCGPKSLYEFGLRCSTRGLGIFPYKVSKSIQDTLLYEEQNLIDPIENLKHKRVFIWTGDKDEFIPADMAIQNQDFYQHFIRDSNKVNLTTAANTVHVFPTINFGDKCDVAKDESENYYLGNCNYSGAYHSLKYLLENRIQTLSNEQLVNQEERLKLAPLLKFNQSEFYPEGSIIDEAAMGKIGFIYIPTACYKQQNKCLLHFNFHGCNEWLSDTAMGILRYSNECISKFSLQNSLSLIAIKLSSKPGEEGLITIGGKLWFVEYSAKVSIWVPSECPTEPLLNGYLFCRPDVAENYIVHSGYLPLAEANNIITVFPLATKVAMQQSMDGCWDFFSYTGSYFATKRGTQIKVVHRMLQRLLHGTEN